MARSSSKYPKAPRSPPFGHTYLEADWQHPRRRVVNLRPLGSTVNGAKEARRIMSVLCYSITAVANDCLRSSLCSDTFPLQTNVQRTSAPPRDSNVLCSGNLPLTNLPSTAYLRLQKLNTFFTLSAAGLSDLNRWEGLQDATYT